jgi:hypothetical protein
MASVTWWLSSLIEICGTWPRRIWYTRSSSRALSFACGECAAAVSIRSVNIGSAPGLYREGAARPESPQQQQRLWALPCGRSYCQCRAAPGACEGTHHGVFPSLRNAEISVGRLPRRLPVQEYSRAGRASKHLRSDKRLGRGRGGHAAAQGRSRAHTCPRAVGD